MLTPLKEFYFNYNSVGGPKKVGFRGNQRHGLKEECFWVIFVFSLFIFYVKLKDKFTNPWLTRWLITLLLINLRFLSFSIVPSPKYLSRNDSATVNLYLKMDTVRLQKKKATKEKGFHKVLRIIWFCYSTIKAINNQSDSYNLFKTFN